MRSVRPGSIVLTFVAAACVLLCGATRPARAEKPVDLVLDVPAKTVLHYKISQDTEGTSNGLAFSAMLNADLEVSRLEDQGEDRRFEVVYRKVEASRKIGEEVQPQDLGLDGSKAQVQVSKHGKLVKFEPPVEATQEKQRMLKGLADAVFVELPAKPVAPEDTWTLDLGDAADKVTASGDYTLESVETKDGVQIAKISGETKMKRETPPVTGKGRTHADIAVPGGYPLLVKGAVDLTPEAGPAVTQSFEIRLEK